MLEQQLTTRRRLSRARVFTVGAVSALTAAAGLGLVARADAGDPPGTIRTIAGVTTNYRQGGFSGDGGPAKDAQLYNPRAVAFSKTGDVYIGDALNHRIRKIDKNGIITTIAGKPAGSSASGSPQGAFGGDGGPATDAQLNQPHGVAVDSKGNVYIADSLNNRIRRIDVASGVITTIAGSDEKHGRPDGPADKAILKFPKSMFMTPEDVLYICNSGGNMILRMDLKTQPLTITRIAGNLYAKRYGGDGGFATDAQLNTPEGVWAMPDGTVYLSDSENNLVRKVGPDGKIATVAGDVEAAKRAAETNQYPIPADSAGDGGPATAAHLNGPRGIAADSAGNVYVAEEGGARIRRIDKDGVITTIAGNGQANPDGHNPKVAGDPGPSPAMEAQFNTIHDLNLDKDGNLWIADSKNNRIRVVFDPAHAPAGTPAAGAPAPGQNPPAQNPPAQSPPPQQPQDPQSPQGQAAPDGKSNAATTTTTAAPATTTTTAKAGATTTTTGKGATTTTTAPATTTTTTTTTGKPGATTTTTAAKAAEPTTTTTAAKTAEPTTTTTAAAAPPK
jgi:sugar lactone lactonase YvrE